MASVHNEPQGLCHEDPFIPRHLPSAARVDLLHFLPGKQQIQRLGEQGCPRGREKRFFSVENSLRYRLQNRTHTALEWLLFAVVYQA